MMSRLRPARERMAWCIVGTAVYHVGSASFIQRKNFMALKPGVQHTLAPAPSEPNTAATNPWMWKRGIILRQWSLGTRARMSRTLAAVAQTLM